MHLSFNLFEEKELEKYSILISKASQLVDNTTSFTVNPSLPCKQCKKMVECPGHMGRIRLFETIVHPLFADILCQEITKICPICKKYNNSNKVNSICCNKKIIKTTFSLHKINFTNINTYKKINREALKKGKFEYAFLFGKQRFSIDKMYEELSNSDFGNNPEFKKKLLNIFIRNIPVLPINLRPRVVTPDSFSVHHNLTALYIKILDLNQQYMNDFDEIIFIKSYPLKVYNLYKRILGVNDSTDDDALEIQEKSCIKQLITGETGIFRSICLSKVQNFCLRSVIISNIDTPLDRILIPKEFTDQLIPYGYKPNDYVIINRQPTLQATSLLAVRSFPSKSKAIQVNPLITGVFQGDFDGDEMNVFWLPGKASQEELSTKLNIVNNFRSYKDASLLILFTQDTLTGLYNMTRNKEIIDTYMIKRICDKLEISRKEWKSFCNYYKSKTNSREIPYSQVLSILLPRTLTLKIDNKILVDHGILVGIINGDNQIDLLNSISHYGNEFYMKFMWDVQRMVHEYNLFHTITISIADCIPDEKILDYYTPILNSFPDNYSSMPLSNLDEKIRDKSLIINKSDQENILYNYLLSAELAKSVDNNLSNIINSGSKGSIDNIVQILFSVGVQALFPGIYLRNSYAEGLTAREIFLHSKSSRIGVISTSMGTSSSGYFQRELTKCMEDITTDDKGNVLDYNKKKFNYCPFKFNHPEIDDSFLEYAYSTSIKNKN